MFINNYETNAKHFAWDGCHKIYLLNPNDKEQYAEAENEGYHICDINELPETWDKSCELRFIRTWDLDLIVPQCTETVVFKDDWGNEY